MKVYSVNKTRPATAARLKMIEEKGLSFTPITRPLELDVESDEQFEAAMKERGGRDPLE